MAKTRFTKQMQDAFINSVEASLPAQVYTHSYFQDKVTKLAVDMMPPPVRALWNIKDMRCWIQRQTAYLHVRDVRGYHVSVTVPYAGANSVEAALASHIKDDLAAAVKEGEQRFRFLQELRAAAGTFRFVEDAAEAMPEYAQYLPKKAAVCKTLPAPTLDKLRELAAQVGFPKKETPAKPAPKRRVKA